MPDWNPLVMIAAPPGESDPPSTETKASRLFEPWTDAAPSKGLRPLTRERMGNRRC